ncbi:LOW QUALITY PROTEIN: probable chitinase 10 [Macrobrachium nipponense]|uniref:LOW QUALITY PROTEIN: probable chitinase 10 n=1 Tax=Macrobrachium nipponense TaxID=159736 RepID=UPI0030C7B0A7
MMMRTLILTLAVTSLSVYCQENPAKNVVCYYSSWSHYRQGLAYYEVEDIPVDQCTHVIYAFAILDRDSLTLRQQDEFADSDSGLKAYRRFFTLRQRNPGAKLLLGLGGWHDSRSDKYSRLVSSPLDREVFSQQAVKFLTQHGFDGLDLNWEFPAYQGSGMDKEGFRLWVKQLRKAFIPQNLLLTATVSGHIGIIDRGYAVKAIAEDLDLINLMAYDFHGPWEQKVAHHAPLYPVPGKHPQLSVDFAVKHWVESGAAPSKIMLGISFYGRSWTLAGPDKFPGALASAAGLPGPLLKVPGTSAYYELCLAENHYDWPKFTRDGGTFLTLYDQWISFDDIDDIRNKAKYVLEAELGGVMVWDVSLDDFRNLCGDGVNPLLSAITSVLWNNGTRNRLPNPDSVLQNTTIPPAVVRLETEPDRSLVSPGTLLASDLNEIPPITGVSIPDFSLAVPDEITNTQVQSQTIVVALFQPNLQTQSTRLEANPSLIDQIYQLGPLETAADYPTTLLEAKVTDKPLILSEKVETTFTLQLHSNFVTSDRVLLQPEGSGALTGPPVYQPSTNLATEVYPSQALFMTILPPFLLSSVASTKSTNLAGQSYRIKTFEDVITPSRTHFTQRTSSSSSPTENIRTEGALTTSLLPSGTTFQELEASFSHHPTETLEIKPSHRTSSSGIRRTEPVYSYELSPPPNESSATASKMPTLYPISFPMKINTTECQRTGYTSDPTSCSHFYRCHGNRAFRFQCTEQTHWKQELLVCDWAYKKFCKKARSLAQPSSHTPMRDGDEIFYDQATGAIGYFSHYIRPAMYTADEIPTEMCTHVIYSSAILDRDTLTVAERDSYLDPDNGLGNYRRFLQLRRRNPKVKLLLGLGGWTDSNSAEYSLMASSYSSRANFVVHAVRLLKSYGFDGLDLDWEYPSDKTSPQEKIEFRLWIEELRAAFDQNDLLLTAAVPAGRNVTDEVRAIATALDQIHIKAYDFHGSWEDEVAHHAPLFPLQSGKPEELSAESVVNQWIDRGVSPQKLILGVPFHGRSWTLARTNTSPGALAKGAGKPGRFVNESGILAYYEICYAHEHDRWQKVSNPGGPYVVKDHQWVIKEDVEVISAKGDQWVGYDDTEAVTKKSDYVKTKGLGGIMISDITMDDFRGMCRGGPNPLTMAIYKTLQKEAAASTNNVRPLNKPSTKRPAHQKPKLPVQRQSAKPFREPINPLPALDVEECLRVGYTPDKKSCKHFYRCVGRDVNHYRCPSGRSWNQTQRGCILQMENSCRSKPLL